MVRKTGKTRTTVSKRKVHEIDGIIYRSKALADLHEQLKEHPLVKSFSLPNVKEEKEHRNKKYGAKKIMINDIVFDSIMEGRYYLYLLEQQKLGEVKAFTRQTTFELQPKFRNQFTGKAVRAITYIADFVVTMPDKTEYVIDVKGKETTDFKLKKKLFEYKYPDKRFMCVQWVASHNEWEDLEDIKKRRRSARKAKANTK